MLSQLLGVLINFANIQHSAISKATRGEGCTARRRISLAVCV